jgi:hypothetical protein
MTKISTYALDTDVTGSDKWIGTDSKPGKLTKNFSADKLAAFFNKSEKFSGGSEMRFTYDTVEPNDDRAAGTFSFETEVGDTYPISDISELVFSRYTSGGNDVASFLQDIVNSQVLFRWENSFTAYGFFTITDVQPHPDDANFYVVSMTYLKGSGVISEDEAYIISVLQDDDWIKNVLFYDSTGDFPATGEVDILYVDKSDAAVYVWDGASTYITKDGDVAWGNISGLLSDQTDLQSALDGKANASHTHTESDITDLDKYTQAEVDALIAAATSPGIKDNYGTIALLLADQGNQDTDFLFLVVDATGDATVDLGWALYQKLSTSTADISDYRKLSEEESLDVIGGTVLPTTTKGDLVVHDGVQDDRLPIGPDGSTLMADSSEPLGQKWSNPTDPQYIKLSKTVDQNVGGADGTTHVLTWDVQDNVDSQFTHNTVLNNDRLYVNVTGWYTLRFATLLQQTGANRSVHFSRVWVNGVIVTKPTTAGYGRGAAFGLYYSVEATVRLNLTAGDYVTVGMTVSDPDDSYVTNVLANNSYIEMVAEPGSNAGPAGPAGPTGGAPTYQGLVSGVAVDMDNFLTNFYNDSTTPYTGVELTPQTLGAFGQTVVRCDTAGKVAFIPVNGSSQIDGDLFVANRIFDCLIMVLGDGVTMEHKWISIGP